MSAPYLPFDIARCQGKFDFSANFMRPCIDCLRRTAPGNPVRQAYVQGVPRHITKGSPFECNLRIAPR